MNGDSWNRFGRCDRRVYDLDAFTRFTLSIITPATTDPPGLAEVERILDASGAVTGYKVKTKESVSFGLIDPADGINKTTDEGVPLIEKGNFFGPQPTRDSSSSSSALQGIIQLQSP